MLPRSARLTSPNDFARATKSGSRASSKFLVVYFYSAVGPTPAKCGLIINKSVGGSVVRHRVARQIRHRLIENLDQLPPGSLLVVRALPGSAKTDIGAELSRLIPKAIEKTLATKTVSQ
ncbi:MAG: ribonuclease P protein component [Candidatus Nanopelagicaceae bacterium]|nr:ribonuclease P protein component [Candidatus Nanopelagicaceae bacterium]